MKFPPRTVPVGTKLGHLTVIACLVAPGRSTRVKVHCRCSRRQSIRVLARVEQSARDGHTPMCRHCARLKGGLARAEGMVAQ